ncbi:MAG: YitT family protein, partial [[Eubacterium] sulci]|nr:YitT family protein [[Eubacterium] sulci]
MSERKGKDAWNLILLTNSVILLTAGFLFGFEKALYSIIFQYCNTQIIKFFYKRYQKHTLLIITDKTQEIYEQIRIMTHHDATLFVGTGCYEGAERKMLYSVVSSDQVSTVIKIIKEIDPKAFINSLKTEELSGRFYKQKKR